MWLVLLVRKWKQYPLTDFILTMLKSTLGFTQIIRHSSLLILLVKVSTGTNVYEEDHNWILNCLPSK